MYYYKIMIDGQLMGIESRNQSPIDLPETMIEITENEYNTILAEIQNQQHDDTQEESENITGDEFMQMLEEVL